MSMGGSTEFPEQTFVLDIFLECRSVILLKLPNENAMVVECPRRVLMSDIRLLALHPLCSISEKMLVME